MRKVLQQILLVSFLACLALPALAQTVTATLSGIVRDQQESVIPGAAVAVTHKETGQVRNTVTSASGDYTVTNLDVGTYLLAVSASGFSTVVIQSIPLQVNQYARVDVTLTVGAASERITVTDVLPLLATSSSAVGQVVENRSIESSALNGRQFWRLVGLTPGATYTPTQDTSSTGGAAIRPDNINIQINGSGRIYNGWLLDGADITEYERGGTQVQPNVDALGEMKVESQNMSAEYGHTPNAISATLKSGTNEYHSLLFEFLRNDKMDARNFFAKTKNALRQNQFGGTFGGPIRRNKLFFFTDLEATPLRQGMVFNGIVPSDAMRRGDFSELLRTSPSRIITDPLDGAKAFPGNIIPANRISPQAAFFLPYMPTQSQANFNAPASFNTVKGDIKVDVQLTSMDHLMARYSINNNTETDPNAFPALGSADHASRGQSATMAWTRVLNPRWLNEARFAYYRSIFLLGGVMPGVNLLEKAGITGFERSQIDPSAPSISISGWAGYSGSGANPKSNRIRTWQYTDNLSYTRGKHDMKVGVQYYHRTDAFFNAQSETGTFTFNNTYTKDGFGDFLLGYPYSVLRSYPLSLYGNWANQPSVYWLDNYRLTQNLTLNIGLRWEFNPFFNPIRGTTSGFDYATGKVIIPMRNGQPLDPTAEPMTQQLWPLFKDRLEGTDALGLPDSIRRSEKDWAPRFGFAWRPKGNNRVVVRGAYGIFWTFFDTNLSSQWAKAPPFLVAQTVINSAPVPTRTWADFFQGGQMVQANPNPGQPCSFGMVLISCVQMQIYSSAPELKQAYMQQWNFTVQTQPIRNLSVEVAYVGNKTTHVALISVPGNDPAPGPGDVQARRPYPQWQRFFFAKTDGLANYNSLQAKVERRFSGGFQVLGSFAYSKCIDTGSNEAAAPAEALIGKPNRAVCDFNMPDVLTVSSVYELPFGKGRPLLSNRNPVVNAVLGGWDVAGILSLRSGLPFTPTITGDRANTGASSQPPNRLGSGTLANPTVDKWFAMEDFAIPAQYTYGNSGRNILTADGLSQLDLSIKKKFPISETKRIEFRTEFFNFTNTPTFSAPNSTINSPPSSGRVTSMLNAPRMLDFGLKFYF